jgi:hypothetical protein
MVFNLNMLGALIERHLPFKPGGNYQEKMRNITAWYNLSACGLLDKSTLAIPTPTSPTDRVVASSQPAAHENAMGC